jgi:hypothetical protein
MQAIRSGNWRQPRVAELGEGRFGSQSPENHVFEPTMNSAEIR